MLEIIIIENEETSAKALLKMLDIIGEEFKLLHSPIKTVTEAIEVLKKHNPDVLFMDVELDDGNAFDILEAIKLDPKTSLIMTTAHDRYAIQAFHFSALNFMLKPYDLQDLEESLKRVLNSQKSNSTQAQVDLLLGNAKSNAGDRSISLNDNKFIHIEKIANICHINADGPYSIFHLIEGQKIVISKNIKHYENVLHGLGFIRCHHSYLVNSNCIKKFDKTNGGELILKNGLTIPVSNRKKEEIISILNNSSIH